MTAPRLNIDLAKIHHNTRVLVDLLGRRGISVSGVTKAALGLPDIARELLAAGVGQLADSRVENIQTMRRALAQAPEERAQRVRNGQAIAAKFTWEKAAWKLLSACKKT